MLEPSVYWPVDLNILGGRLIEVVVSLTEIRQQLHDSMVAERSKRFHTYMTSAETTHAAKEREADTASLTEWIVVQDCKLELQNLEEERDLLYRLMEHHA